ncbi:MAG: Small subunit (SSU) processome component [Phylliscum demangeonii]|nr:MAG: Small subunit (SSU) processome component [Phylliscum demangeonii]
MVRKLKHHEAKLLRKVDFTTWPSDGSGHRAAAVCRRYHIQQPDDYHKYNRLCGQLRKFALRLARMAPDDGVRLRHEELLLQKLWDMAILGNGGGQGRGQLSDVETKVTVSAMARRRLPVVMMRLHMCENLTAGTRFVEQGHVRIGPDVVTDPSLFVTRKMEDFLTWSDSSKIKRNILKYRDKLDDYDLL